MGMLLLGGAVSTVVVGWGYNARKLIKQVEDATGEKAAWLPFLWEHVIRFVTPAILWVLFFYLFAKDVSHLRGLSHVGRVHVRVAPLPPLPRHLLRGALARSALLQHEQKAKRHRDEQGHRRITQSQCNAHARSDTISFQKKKKKKKKKVPALIPLL